MGPRSFHAPRIYSPLTTLTTSRCSDCQMISMGLRSSSAHRQCRDRMYGSVASPCMPRLHVSRVRSWADGNAYPRPHTVRLQRWCWTEASTRGTVEALRATPKATSLEWSIPDARLSWHHPRL